MPALWKYLPRASYMYIDRLVCNTTRAMAMATFESTRCPNFTPYSVDVKTWSRPGNQEIYIRYNESLSSMPDVLRLAAEGNHRDFAKALSNLDSTEYVNRISVEHSLMTFVMLDDPRGASLVVADENCRTYIAACACACTDYALRNDKVAYIKWALADNCKCKRYADDACCMAAGDSGTARILDCLGNSKIEITPHLLIEAIYATNVAAIKWYIDAKYPVGRWACQRALKGGKLKSLEYLLERNVPIDPSHVTLACRHNAAIFNMLLSMGVALSRDDSSMCTTAVSYNNLEVLKWCKDNNFKWNVSTFMVAFNQNAPASKEMLYYLWTKGCPRPEWSMIHNLLGCKHMISHLKNVSRTSCKPCSKVSRTTSKA